ncbi:MAG: hypothetical protein HS122_13725 [Opitutaceae bacterium]|nr:hypothetical protein [Opitutaceae bacterium]
MSFSRAPAQKGRLVIRLHGSRKTIRNGCGSWCETQRGPKPGSFLERLQRMPGQITVRLVRFKRLSRIPHKP